LDRTLDNVQKGAGGNSIKIINAVEGAAILDVVASDGEEVVMNIIKRNETTIKELAG